LRRCLPFVGCVPFEIVTASKKACYEGLVFHRPSAQLRDRFPEPPAVFCEPIFCFGWHLLIHGALDQSVALQITQGLDQHFFGDVGNLALQLVEPPHLAERDAVEDDGCPFVTDQVEDAPSRKAEVIGAVPSFLLTFVSPRCPASAAGFLMRFLAGSDARRRPPLRPRPRPTQPA